MVTILPSRPLITQSNQLIMQLLAIYLAILIFAIILANVMARSITNRLSSVIMQMKKVRQGPPVPMESPMEHDEVGDLIDTYNYMTRKMNELIQKQLKASEDLRIAEFNSLQAQINPHFLYNTMDMINWQALQGHTNEVSTAVQNLSRFYKLTLSRKRVYPPLSVRKNMFLFISLSRICVIMTALISYPTSQMNLWSTRFQN